jgi:2-amino-4-hydroxy-6-hydroxymethyldihydropteridine diphosphokinase
MNIVYIGLGSNLENPIVQIQQALLALQALPNTQLLTHSSLYQSTPLGPANQPDYINAVAGLNTILSPFELLSTLQAIENKQGRVRNGQRWGPRTLDLDILLYNDYNYKSPQLILPHPGIYERAFVLYPLYECNPTLILPNGQPLHQVMANCSTSVPKKIDSFCLF